MADERENSAREWIIGKNILISCKETEYGGRLFLAMRRGDTERARKTALTLLVVYRMMARSTHAETCEKHFAILGLRRSAAKLKEKGITVSLVEARIKKLEEERDSAEKNLSYIGGQICRVLDLWQSNGASFEDLCNLCNRNPDLVRNDLLDAESQDDSFSSLVTVNNLDYKNPRDTGWIEDSVDAPLTHATKAFLLDCMLNTEAGKKAAHEAMGAMFPELMGNAMMRVVDEDGIEHFYDRNGNEVYTAYPDE